MAWYFRPGRGIAVCWLIVAGILIGSVGNCYASDLQGTQALKLERWQKRIARLALEHPGQILFAARPGQERQVALTFDDGPDRVNTAAIARLLSAAGAHGTFFVNCSAVKAHPGQLEQLTAAGHQIGNHTWSHPHLSRLPASLLQHEISDCEKSLPVEKPLFRPPFGEVGERELSYLSSKGLRAILWSVDSLDWAGIPSSRISERVIAGLRPGAIVLMHSGPASGATVRELPEILKRGAALGYRFVTLDKLLAAGIDSKTE